MCTRRLIAATAPSTSVSTTSVMSASSGRRIRQKRKRDERTWSLLGSRVIEELIDLPLMSDPVSVATLDVLSKVVQPALCTDANLESVAICGMVNLSLEYGNADASCVGYVWLGAIAGQRFGNYKAGVRFGQLGYDLVEKRGLKRFEARTYLSFGNHMHLWNRHVRTGRDLMRRAFDLASATGDLTFGAYTGSYLITNRLAAGDPLAHAQREAEQALEFARKARF